MQGWLDRNLIERVANNRMIAKPAVILSIPQHTAALRSLRKRPRAMAWYVLSCLCGLRPDEARQTRWQDIELCGDSSLVRVEAQTSKQQQRRVVYPHPVAVQWLRQAKKLGAELPLTQLALTRAQRALRKATGLPRWTQSITRHTASAYWTAVTQNAPAVAEACGHDIRTMKRHYWAVVTKEVARRFWSITPRSLDETSAIQVDFTNETTQLPTSTSTAH
jgi:integrase